MRERLILWSRLACLVLAAVAGLQTYALLNEGDPLAGLDLETVLAAGADPMDASTAKDAGTPPKPAAGGGARERPSAPPDPEPLPDRHAAIATSGVLGSPPGQKPPPALLGLLGGYAIVRAPDGSTDAVPEGGKVGDVQVLRIGTNRALVEWEGKRQELTIFDGIGGEPLLEPNKEEAKP